MSWLNCKVDNCVEDSDLYILLFVEHAMNYFRATGLLYKAMKMSHLGLMLCVTGGDRQFSITYNYHGSDK